GLSAIAAGQCMMPQALNHQDRGVFDCCRTNGYVGHSVFWEHQSVNPIHSKPDRSNISRRNRTRFLHHSCISNRSISIRPLNVLAHVHAEPIHLISSEGSNGEISS